MSCGSSRTGRDTPGDRACPGQVSGDERLSRTGGQESEPWTLLQKVLLSGSPCLHPIMSLGSEERRVVLVLRRSGPAALWPHPPPGRCPPYPVLVVGREPRPAAIAKPQRVPGTHPARPGAGTLNPRDFSAAAAGSPLGGHFQFCTERGGVRAEPVSYLPRRGRGGRSGVRDLRSAPRERRGCQRPG